MKEIVNTKERKRGRYKKEKERFYCERINQREEGERERV